MNRTDLLSFLRRHRLCVHATGSDSGAPQAAVVGYGVSDDLEVVFDTLATTRKAANLRRDPRIALVVGWDEEQTVQMEGLADEPTGAELARLKRVYFAAYPDVRSARDGRASPTCASDRRGPATATSGRAAGSSSWTRPSFAGVDRMSGGEAGGLR